MTNDEKKIKHLEMIEKIIERMASNSFKLKGWAVTLVAVIGAIIARDSDKYLFFLVFIPIVMFWYLDAFYLQLERKYRELYERVRKQEGETDFSMKTSEISKDKIKLSFRDCFWSTTEAKFYMSMLGLAIAALILINRHEIGKFLSCLFNCMNS